MSCLLPCRVALRDIIPAPLPARLDVDTRGKQHCNVSKAC